MRIVVTPTQLTPQEFEQFQRLVFESSGIRIPENKVMLLSNRIRRRLKATGMTDFQAYFALLKSPRGRDEMDGFLAAVTTNETSFYRTEKHFEWLQTRFVNDLIERARSGQHPKRIRIWSAACSTGEELYTMAICLAENARNSQGGRSRSTAPTLAHRLSIRHKAVSLQPRHLITSLRSYGRSTSNTIPSRTLGVCGRFSERW